MQPKIKKLKVLKLESIFDVGKSLLEEELYISHNKEIGKLPASKLYHLTRGSTENPNISSVIQLTEALEKVVIERYPHLTFKLNYLHLYDPDDWGLAWEYYGCEFTEFQDFVKDYDFKASTVYNFVTSKKMKHPPRLQTIMLVSAYFLFVEQSQVERTKYRVLKPVNFNTQGAKLQLKELRAQKFWKDKNGA